MGGGGCRLTRAEVPAASNPGRCLALSLSPEPPKKKAALSPSSHRLGGSRGKRGATAEPQPRPPGLPPIAQRRAPVSLDLPPRSLGLSHTFAALAPGPSRPKRRAGQRLPPWRGARGAAAALRPPASSPHETPRQPLGHPARLFAPRLSGWAMPVTAAAGFPAPHFPAAGGGWHCAPVPRLAGLSRPVRPCPPAAARGAGGGKFALPATCSPAPLLAPRPATPRTGARAEQGPPVLSAAPTTLTPRTWGLPCEPSPGMRAVGCGASSSSSARGLSPSAARAPPPEAPAVPLRLRSAPRALARVLTSPSGTPRGEPAAPTNLPALRRRRQRTPDPHRRRRGPRGAGAGAGPPLRGLLWGGGKKGGGLCPRKFSSLCFFS